MALGMTTLRRAMAELSEGQRVWSPNPNGDGEVRAIFHEVIVDDPVEVNGVPRDQAWTSWDEPDSDGGTFKVPYFRLRPRDD
jgi:hypothetical protein